MGLGVCGSGANRQDRRLALRKWTTLKLPVGDQEIVTVELRRPLTPAQWENLMACLSALRPGLVRGLDTEKILT